MSENAGSNEDTWRITLEGTVMREPFPEQKAALDLLSAGAEGIRQWNQRRREGIRIPSLCGINLYGADLEDADLGGADLSDAVLQDANLRGVDLSGATLQRADLRGALPNSRTDDDLLKHAKRAGKSHIVDEVELPKLRASGLKRIEIGGQLYHLDPVTLKSLDDANLQKAIVDDDADLLRVPWRSLRFESEFYDRNDVEAGRKLLPIGMGDISQRLAENNKALQDKVAEQDAILTKGLREAKVFLSYNHDDGEVVREVQTRLEDKGITTWMDWRQQHIGDPLKSSIAEGIRDALVVVVFVSDAALTSDWVQLEISLAGEKCLPVLLDKIKEEQLPKEIRDRVFIELLERYLGGGREAEDYDRCANALLSAIQTKIQRKRDPPGS